MEKVPTIKKYACFLLLVFITTIAYTQDFKVQHIQDDIGNSGGSNTSIDAVTLANAVALANNNRKVNAGANGITTAMQGDDVAGARKLTGTGTLTYYRESGSRSDNMRFNTSIWEYIGTGGGANEFIIRGRYAVSLNGTTNSTTQALTGVVNAEKCIPFITGIMNDVTTQGADSGTAIAYLSDSSTLNVLKGSNGNNVTVYITVVEFTGSNWTVLHGDSGSTATDTGTITLNDDEDGSSGTTTSVNDWSEAIIFTHHIGDTDANGVNDARSDNWPILDPGSDNQSVDWTFHSNHDSGGTNRHFAHVLTNSNIIVTRFQDTSSTAGESTVNISSAGLTDLSQAMIVGSSTTSGTNAYYARGWRNYYLNSTTEAAHWSHRNGDTMSHELQIVNFAEPVLGPAGITSNIELWLKADDGVEEAAGDNAEDNDDVLNWLDISGGSNDATQATPGNKPTYTDAALNFNPVIDFDGDDLLQTGALSTNSDMTIFTVGEGQSGTDKQILNLNGGDNIIIEYEDSTPTFKARMYDGANTGEISTTTGVANGTPFITNYDLYSGTNSELFINGASTGTDATNTYAPTSPIANIGGHPSNTAKRWDGGIAEMIIYSGSITNPEREKIQSYLAIKYGITLGTNGTSQDYVDSDGRIIWDQSDNIGYNYNVTGVGRDDASTLSQKQSKTVNTTDDITIGIIDIATSNGANTSEFLDDKTFLMWGHDNGATTAGTDITKDFSSGVTGVTTSVSATPIERIWKIVNSDSVPTIKLSIPESMVSASNPGGEEYIMIVADDDSFTTNVTSATMEDVGTELEVDFFFEGTKYITFGSTAISSEMSRAVSFDRTQDTYLTAGDVNDLANTDFTISAWVKRNTGVGKFDVVSKRNYSNENRDIDPGPDNDGTYTHGYAFRINQSNQFRMVWRDPEDSSNQIMQTSATIPEDEWHHIAATYDSGTNMTSLYIDGYLEDSDDTLNPMNTPSDCHFMIGAANHIKRQQQHDGSVDEVRVWNVALSGDQIRYIMNQEIEENGSLNADGKILPSATTKNEIVSVPWNNLIAYYPMSRMVFGSVKDESNSGNDASMMNYNLVDEQTAPLPYKTTQDGDWDSSTTWVNGDVQYLPGVDSYLDALETIDYNIVQIDHEITLDNSNTSLIPADRNGNRTVLGLIINSGGELQVDGETDEDTSTYDGYSITISHYLKLDGKIDLEGESQMIQTTDSDLDVTSSGSLERDQQGTKDFYTYNYWSSPVGLINTSTNNTAYRLTNNILKDGSDAASPKNITFTSSGYNGSKSETDITIADYWIWKYANKQSQSYSSWQHVRRNGLVNIGEGFSMKGVDNTSGSISDTQNYVFEGKPNNGDITLTLSPSNDYLIGNPYPSAIDADEFILDNISDGAGRAASNIIDGTLYFWEHFASNTHYLKEYQGGYGLYNLTGSTAAVTTDALINTSGSLNSSKGAPGQYIPISQGFFVVADAGGTVTFKNSQRVFQKEGGSTSKFIKPGRVKTKVNTNKNTSKVDNRKKLHIKFDSPDGYHRQLLVGADEKCSNDFDLGYDSQLIENNKEDMYWVQNGTNLVIQAINNFNENTTLGLGTKISKSGIAKISIDGLLNIDSAQNIQLHDKELALYHNLRDSDYEVYLEAGQHNERFEISFAQVQQLSVDDILNKNLQVYHSKRNDKLIIHNQNSITIEAITIFSILGQKVYSNNEAFNKSYKEFKTNNITSGVYLVELKTNEGMLTKKVLIN